MRALIPCLWLMALASAAAQPELTPPVTADGAVADPARRSDGVRAPNRVVSRDANAALDASVEGLAALGVLLDLGTTPAQAARMLVPVRQLHRRLETLERQRSLAAGRVRPYLLSRRSQGLSKAVSPRVANELASYEQTLAAVEQERATAFAAAYEAVAGLLTPEQRALLGSDAVAPTMDAATVAARRASTHQAVVGLLRSARNTADPNRFAAAAPAAVAEHVTALTGLTANDRRFAPLAALFLDRLQTAYRLQPAEFLQHGATLAAELAGAALQVVLPSSSAAGDASLVRRLDRALRYAGLETVLTDLARASGR